ncbi:MAG: general secretion pathway protein GspB [Desulfobacterales bacterium]|nr:general secretion pathway protein GspB [Desulfobacterales bacterium]MBL7101327.1 general secretion pathway protein GspB [Desulfobacteraceae bacterium]MBL7171244.1 general secretion pathway protein GspB [Desulfobacteraceae bacterium]
MSFILDALKRAERERRLERAPDLSAVYEENNLPRRTIQPWLWLSGSFLVGAMVVGLVLWPEGPDPAQEPKPIGPARIATEVAMAPPKEEPKPAAVAPDTKPAPTSGETSTTLPPPVAAVEKVESVQSSPPLPQVPEETPIKPATPDPPKAAEKMPEAPVNIKGPDEAPVAPPKEPIKSVSGRAPIPLVSELPYEVREKLGRLQINVHAYSKDPAECLVFINMRNYKVGDRIGEGGPVLKEITPGGVIIDYGEGQALLQVWR